MTVAVACYIALSAVANANSKTNVAGANDNPETDLPDSPQKQVYSTLPRACEKVDGKSVAHFGGEGEEKLLDAFSFAGKSVLIVSCDSSQYDVKETGIYAAIFSGTTLENQSESQVRKGAIFALVKRATALRFSAPKTTKRPSKFTMKIFPFPAKTQLKNSTT